MVARKAVKANEEKKSDVRTIKRKRFGTMHAIPGLRTEELSVLIIGTMPLIVHNFSRKLREQILAKHMGEASEGREKKDPIANFHAAKYISSEGWEGIPASGLKAGIVQGFMKGAGAFKSDAKGGIRVHADDTVTNLVRLIYPQEPPEVAAIPHFPNETGRAPRCREDVVRNDSGVVDIRHRPEYWPWAAVLRIEFMPTVCSERQLLQAIAVSGFKVGQCEWRPSSKESLSGSYGTFRIADEAEINALDNGKLFADYRFARPVLQAAE
mgnify:CR=1 FL=1